MAAKKCLVCKKKFVDKIKLVNHMNRCHSDVIPKDWTASRYENYLRTGKTHGNCVECGMETEWNESTMKYHRYCSNPECKKKAREKAKTNYIGKWGKVTRLDEPDVQKRMVYARKNSGKYTWSDKSNNEPIMYDSTYGLDFLKMCDVFLDMSGSDMMGPSPNVYYYMYENKKHFYIPDFYIPSLNLEVEIKDGGDNPNMHPKIQAVDKVKESLKDEVMNSQPNVRYIKICNKQYDEFFKLLMELKNKDETIKQKDAPPDQLVDIMNDIPGITTESMSSKQFTRYLQLLKISANPIDDYDELNKLLFQMIQKAKPEELPAIKTFVYNYHENLLRAEKSGKISPAKAKSLITTRTVLVPLIDYRMRKEKIEE